MYKTCPCSINAVHPASNCPTCNGTGIIKKESGEPANPKYLRTVDIKSIEWLKT